MGFVKSVLQGRASSLVGNSRSRGRWYPVEWIKKVLQHEPCTNKSEWCINNHELERGFQIISEEGNID